MSQTYGKTRWKRFAVVMVPSIAATAAIGVSLAQGALAASFNVSGQRFKVTADHLVGKHFAQYGSIDTEKSGTHHPVAVSSFKSADINHLCQSVTLPTPIGPVSLQLTAGNGEKDPVHADNLFIDLDQLDADATFSGINIGVATGSLTKGAANPGDRAVAGSVPGGEAAFDNSFAQEADSATLDNVSQYAWATSASTFKLNNLHLGLQTGTHECS
jgi:hypothetical protein